MEAAAHTPAFLGASLVPSLPSERVPSEEEPATCLPSRVPLGHRTRRERRGRRGLCPWALQQDGEGELNPESTGRLSTEEMRNGRGRMTSPEN